MTYNGQTFDVQMEAGLHSDSGQVYASFYSIDSNTGLPPSSALTGFLPPEDGTGRGQGYINYSVSPKITTPTGQVIPNVAYVTFDSGVSIATNQVSELDPTQGTDPTKEARVTIDANIPTAQVSALATCASASNLIVSWSGSGGMGGSGIATYTVYVSSDGGTSYTPWLRDTPLTSGTYLGTPGVSYSFYVAARSNVGNVQTANLQNAARSTQALVPISFWRWQNFNLTTNTGVAADDAIPDLDGLANLLKYGLVIVPGSSGTKWVPGPQVYNYAEGNRLRLNFSRDPTRNDITVEVQTADSPAGPWTSVATSASGAAFSGPGFVGESNGSGGLKNVEVRDTVNIGSASRRFMRIKVTP